MRLEWRLYQNHKYNHGNLKYVPKIKNSLQKLVIGIIETNIIELNMNDFSNIYDGYAAGIYTSNWCFYEKGNNKDVNEYINEYRLNYQDDGTKYLRMTMTLDLSTKNGILEVLFNDYHHLMHMSEYNILCDNIDVNKQYKLAISMYAPNCIALIN